MNTLTYSKKLICCRKQSKRLATLFSVSTAVAQMLLARGIYQCSSWDDLKSRIRSSDTENSRLKLIGVHRGSDALEISALEKEIPFIAKDIHQLILSPKNELIMRDISWQIFGFESGKPKLSDMYDSMPDLLWYDACIGSDPKSVLQAEIRINGINVLLMATRIHAPELYHWSTDEEKELIAFERSIDGLPDIIWSDPEDWLREQKRYVKESLSSTKDDDIEAPQFPDPEMTDVMAAHQSWFYDACRRWRFDSDDYLIPIQLHDAWYLIFGSSVGVDSRLASSFEEMSVPFPEDMESMSFNFLVKCQPICIDMMNSKVQSLIHIGDVKEQIEANRKYIETQISYSHLSSIGSGCERNVVFLRPMSRINLEDNLGVKRAVSVGEAACSLKSNDTDSAIKIIEMLYKLECFINADEPERELVFVKIPCSTALDFSHVQIGLDALFSDGGFLLSNLTTQSQYSNCDDSEGFLYLTIQSKFFGLIKLTKKKTLMDALRYGLLFKLSEEEIRSMDSAPMAILSKIDDCSDLDRNVVSMRNFKIPENWTLSDLFDRSYSVCFERDDK